MKKFYLAAAALLAAMVPAMGQRALTIGQKNLVPAPLSLTAQMPQTASEKMMYAPGDANNVSMTLGYCGEIAGALAINPGETGVAIQFPVTMMSQFAGNQISSILVATGLNSQQSTSSNWVNTATKCTVFISETLGGTPVYEQEATLKSQGGTWDEITLDTPYTIKEDKNVYVGVMYKDLSSSEMVVVADQDNVPNNNTFYLYSRFGSVNQQGQIVLQQNYAWKEFAQYIGGNVCLKAKVTGDNLPQDRAYILDYSAPISIKPGEKFNFVIAAQNEGANQIQNVEVTMTIGDAQPQTYTCTMLSQQGVATPVSYGDYGFGICEFTYDKEGNNIPFKARITKVNGIENKYTSSDATGTLLSLENGYDYKVVAEELTSTMCAYCPIGLTAMEMMKEKYGDKFIPIGVHANIPQPRDPMDVCSQGGPYYDFAMEIGTAPALKINRKVDLYPHPIYVEQEMESWVNSKAMAELSATISTTEDEKEVELNIEMESALTDDSGYGFSYTIVEDGLGPYQQLNGYSGQSNNYYGWESKPQRVTYTYDDVARNGSVFSPIENSLPATIEKGEVYNFSTKVDLTYVKDLSKYSIVAMLVNKKTGYIENACVVKSPTDIAVDKVTSEASSVAVGLKGAVNMIAEGNIFAIDGRAVALNVKGMVEVPAGVYMVTTSAGTAKVLVR